MSKEYRIEHVADFLSVPDGRLEDCLTDFRVWLTLARRGKPVADLVRTVLGLPKDSLVVSTKGFTWIDDNKPGLSGVQIVSESGESLGRIPIE